MHTVRRRCVQSGHAFSDQEGEKTGDRVPGDGGRGSGHGSGAGAGRLYATGDDRTQRRPRHRRQARFGTVDCREVKCIALTFDAGPGEHSARLLDVLKEEQVPVTFFLVGRRHIERYPELVRRMADEGHEVADHTWTHRRLTELEPDETREELERTDEERERLTGRRPALMRPPRGRTDDTVHEISRELGLSEVLWSVTAKDCTTTDSGLITRRVLAKASRDGIVLLHDLCDGTAPASSPNWRSGAMCSSRFLSSSSRGRRSRARCTGGTGAPGTGPGG